MRKGSNKVQGSLKGSHPPKNPKRKSSGPPKEPTKTANQTGCSVESPEIRVGHTVVKVIRQGGRAGLQYRRPDGDWVITWLRYGLSEPEIEAAATTLVEVPMQGATREVVKERLKGWRE